MSLCQSIHQTQSLEVVRQPNRASLLQLQTIGLKLAQADDFHSALNLAVQQVCQSSGWDYGEAWEFNPQTGYLQCRRTDYGPQAHRDPQAFPGLEHFRQHRETLSFLPGMGLPGRVWVQKQPEWVPDISQLSPSVFPQVRLGRKIGLKATFAVPIVAENRAIAVLQFFTFKSRPEDRRMVELISEISTHLGAVIQHKQSEEALRQAEEKYRRLFEHSIEGIFQSTPEGHYLLVNPTLAQIYGYDSPAELIREISDIEHQLYVDPNRRAQFKRLLEKNDALWNFESQCYRKDGSIIWIAENARAIRDANGVLLGYEGTAIDITQRKQAEARFAALVENSSDIIAILAADGTIEYGSSSLDRLLGYNPETLVGQNWLEYVHPEDRSAVADVLLTPPADRPAQTDCAIPPAPSPSATAAIEYRFRHADGSWLDIESVSNRRLDDPTIQGIVVNSRSIAQRKQAESQLHHRLLIEAALSKISRLFVSTREPDFGKILALLGIAARVNRAYIFSLDEHDRKMSQIYQWCDRDKEAEGDPAAHLDLQQFPWLMQQLSTREICPIEAVEELPPTASAEKALLRRLDARAVLLVPIYSPSDTLWGFIGLDAREPRRWSPGDVHLLRVIGQMMSSYYQRKQAESALRQAERKYRSIFENAVEGIFQTTPAGRYLTANPMLARIYGYDSPRQLMAQLTDIEHQLYVDPQRRKEFRRLLQEREAVWGFESRVYRRDGSTIWISESARTIRDANGRLLGYEGTVVDITQRKQAEAELHQRDSLLLGVAEAMNHLLTELSMPEAVMKALATLGTAAGVERVYICEAIARRSNPNHNSISHELGNICHPDSRELAANCANFEGVRACEFIVRFQWRCNDRVSAKREESYTIGENSSALEALCLGNPRAIFAQSAPEGERASLQAEGTLSMLMVPILVEREFWGYIGFDATRSPRSWSKSEESILIAIAASIGGALQRHYQEEIIRHQAYHDRLTGLPNRQVLDERLPLALETARICGHQVAVMFLDLDRFKIINDTLGHAIGDELLERASVRLRNCLREEDIIVRWGGDEFILLLDRLSTPEDAAQIAERLLECLRPAFYIEGNQLYITGSIGIALYPNDAHDAETLIKNADIALYRVKEQGRNDYQLYAPGMNSQASELWVLDNYLHTAFSTQEFLIYYQPQVNLHTGKITAMEALLRWQHPTLGVIPPDKFMPLAEENGLILPLGLWVLETACTQHQKWRESGLPPVRMVVNLSARQFQQPNLVEAIAQVLQTTGLDSQWLGLDITETTAMQDANLTVEVLTQLQQMGVSTAIDDFGIGYASLNYLKKFSFRMIKIHQSFVGDLAKHSKDYAIVSAIITLAEQLNMKVVAEGVETEAQRDCLLQLNCHDMQGYLFSRPLDAEGATQLLQNGLWRPND